MRKRARHFFLLQAFLARVIRLDGLGLDDAGRVAALVVLRLGRDGSCYIAAR